MKKLDNLIQKLKKRLDKIDKTILEYNYKIEITDNKIKKKLIINKKIKYMLIIYLIFCIVCFLYFYSQIYFSITIPKIHNPFNGENININDFAEYKNL